MNNQYLQDTLFLLESEISDLEKWSVSNEDKALSIIIELKDKAKELRIYINNLLEAESEVETDDFENIL